MDFDGLDVLVVVDKCVVLDLVDGEPVSFELLFFEEICRAQVNVLKGVEDLLVGLGVDNDHDDVQVIVSLCLDKVFVVDCDVMVFDPWH